jgi:hypothetical protein
LAYLKKQSIRKPLEPTLLLGTSTWRISDAVRLAHALAQRTTYGGALSDEVLGLMEAPKYQSREAAPGELTAPLRWGAGVAFNGLRPAYKAGWGGIQQHKFLAGQLAVVSLPGGHHLAVAVMFHPDREPIRDDPGLTVAPRAIETVMRAIRNAVFASGPPSYAKPTPATPSSTPPPGAGYND